LETNTFLTSYYKQLVYHSILTSFQFANIFVKVQTLFTLDQYFR